MTPSQAAMLELLETQRTTFTDDLKRLATEDPAPPGLRPTTPEELEQMANGFFAMLAEGLQGTSSEIRTFYLETLLPSLRDSGVKAKPMIGGSARVILQLTGSLVAAVPAGERANATAFLARFLGDYLGDIADVWEHRPQ
jgi:hypothetical protein